MSNEVDSDSASTGLLSEHELAGKFELASDTLITARGTSKGLVIRIILIDDPLIVQSAVRDFMVSRSSFLKGSEVFIEWLVADGSHISKDRLKHLTEEYLEQLKGLIRVLMQEEFSVKIRDINPVDLIVDLGSGTDCNFNKIETFSDIYNESGKYNKSGNYKETGKKMAGSRDSSELEEALSLFDGIDGEDDFDDEDMFEAEDVYGIASPSKNKRFSSTAATNKMTAQRSYDGALPFDETLLENVASDEADCRMIVGTLRSGQRIESEHSLIILGDVNTGAELIAGGDIIVLGKLRGVAHAGAYDETGGGRVIIALDLVPTQLRIGSVITRGGGGSSAEGRAIEGKISEMRAGGSSVAGILAKNLSGLGVEIARVEGNLIVVEQYSSRARLR
jgi:septum formation inhibitor MinC